MMRVYVDEQVVPIARPTLAAALAAGRDAASLRQRVIVEAKLDGVAIADADLHEPSDTPLEDGDVRFVTAEPRALVRTSLMDTREALEEVLKIQALAAEALHGGKLAEGLELIGSSLAVWDAVRRVSEQGPALLNVAFDSVSVAGRPLRARATELAGCLEQVKSALSAQDWSLLADLLEGELSDAARAWRTVLADLAEQTAAGRLGQPSEQPR
ncbi:MAG: hypothetical protein ACKVS8_06550 [Phycisphaerales bacterium]